MPTRGAIAFVITALALALLLSFKTPSDSGLAAATGAPDRVAVAPPVAGRTAPATGTPSGSTGSTAGGAMGSTAGGPTARTRPGQPTPAAVSTPARTPGATANPGGSTGQAGGGSATTAAQTVTGPEVDTRFGPVQVEVTLSGSKITDITPLELPTGRHSGQISQWAAPVLHDEALQAQSAQIDIVSGATYTSLAYAQSLQAALDSAN